MQAPVKSERGLKFRLVYARAPDNVLALLFKIVA